MEETQEWTGRQLCTWRARHQSPGVSASWNLPPGLRGSSWDRRPEQFRDIQMPLDGFQPGCEVNQGLCSALGSQEMSFNNSE